MRPPWLSVTSGTEELLPGTQGTVEAGLGSSRRSLVPAQQVSLLLRVRNTTRPLDSRDFEVRVTVPVVDAPFEVRAEPALLRARDHAPSVCSVVVDNARSNQWAQVQLSAGTPKTWSVPPGPPRSSVCPRAERPAPTCGSRRPRPDRVPRSAARSR